MSALGLARRGGTWLGVAGGVALASALLHVSPAAGLGAGSLHRGIEFAVLCALGGALGLLFDDLRRERAIRRALAAAGRELSAAAEEPLARRTLLEHLIRVRADGVFEVHDDFGGKLSSEVRKPGWFGRWGKASEAPWSIRPLAAGGRELGVVRWRFPAGSARDPLAEELAAAIVDLGALAIGRVRLTAEKAAMEDVVRAEQLRTVLLDAVSHHFRSPLAGILGSVTTILDLPEPQERRVRTEFLLIIKEQANRLSRYVENFLSLARLEAGSIEISLSDTNLETLVYDVWDTFGEFGGARRYLQVEVEPETIRSDPRLLGQALGNVLENAIKYSPEESLIDVRGQVRGGRLMIEVADQGCGAPEASLTRMFDRFYRHHAISAPGIGLGLYITRSLVQMLGGEVSARSRADGETGLVVAISLPIAETTP